jgi:dTDP-4-amino-4,6-dideoxygalactose transaminase
MPETVKQVPLVDLKAQHSRLQEPIQRATERVLERADFILGEEVSLFEQEFASYCGVRHAVGVDSGLAALELSLRAFDVGPGDEVITVANSFIATALAISSTGATPVLVDVDPDTYTMDVDALRRAISIRTKAVIPVHLYGQPADMDTIMKIAERQGLIVIEDACQAHGGRYKGRRTGSLGHAAAFSFYPTKNLGGFGDGGMVVTDIPQVTDRLRVLRNYGQREKHDHVVRGFNRRLDTLQASVLRVKLPQLDCSNDSRRQHAARYTELLSGSGILTPAIPDYAEPVWHQYVIRTPHRDALSGFLAKARIATGIHYPVPIHLQTAYRDLGYPAGSFPVTETCARGILSLPMYPEMTSSAVEYVAATIREFTPGPARYSDAGLEATA